MKIFYYFLTLLLFFSPNRAQQEEDVFATISIDTEAKLISALARYMPHVLAIRNPLSDSEEMPEQFDELKGKLFMKGIKTNLFLCSEYNNTLSTDLYPIVLQSLCGEFEDSWRFLALPYFESELPVDFKIQTIEDMLLSSNTQVVNSYIMEKLQLSSDEKDVYSSKRTFFSTFEEAARDILKSYPQSVVVLEEDHVVSFITNAVQYGKTEIITDAREKINLDGYPLIFFSEEKVKEPPQMLQAFASFTTGLTNVAFVHNPKGKVLQDLGLPANTVGKNTLLAFAIKDGQVLTFMYDKAMFGKFSALSLFGFFANLAKSFVIPNQQFNSFELWLKQGLNQLRIPATYDFGSPTEEEEDIAQGQPTVEFTKSTITFEKQINTEQLATLCGTQSDDESAISASMCVLSVFDRFTPDASEKIATLVEVQDSFYELTSLLGSTRQLPFNLNFNWIDSVCNKDLLETLGVDASAVPTLVTIFHTSTGVMFSNVMVKAFNTKNSVEFLKEQFQFRKLLFSDETEKSYKKYINRVNVFDKDTLLSKEVRETCAEGGSVEEEEDMSEMLREIREEERLEREKQKEQLRQEEEEAKLNEKVKKKSKKKKKKKKKSKKSKKEL